MNLYNKKKSTAYIYNITMNHVYLEFFNLIEMLLLYTATHGLSTIFVHKMKFDTNQQILYHIGLGCIGLIIFVLTIYYRD